MNIRKMRRVKLINQKVGDIMAIKIGHASSNENRKSKGGNAGDQTGR